MKKLILFLGLTASLSAGAQKERAAAYIEAYKELAITEMIRSGVPASITLAQGMLESSYGESELAKKSNNHFGIKCKTEWTGPKTYHDDDERGECFRVYGSVEESYRDHSDFLKNRPYYAALFKLDPADAEGWAYGLKKAGYATERDYPQRLLKLIGDYNLQQYTLNALAKMKGGNEGEKTPVLAAGPSQPVIDMTPAATVKNETKGGKEETENGTEAETVTPPASSARQGKPVKPAAAYAVGSIFAINHTKVTFAAEGTALLALANQYNISLAKLLEFNDLPEMDVLDTDRLIFLERKMKKGATDIHVVAADETLHDISQKEGVRLDNLLEYNNLKREARPHSGDKIYLRAASPATAAKSSKASR